jgi:DNA primase
MSTGVVAEIKSKLPILELAGETVALKRAGAAYKGLCPFHAEKTPSFIVSPDRETFHCFGCGEHGDIFTFLMRREGLDFREALGRLAERTGVELSDRSAREDRHRARLRDALEQAIAWYREVLLRSLQAQRARDYLAERGLSEETLDRFGIGYALNNWEALTKRLRARGFSDAELTAAGLASPSNRGGIYDRFRGRIIIPIRDASGRAMGLGGRIMPGAEGPKYLNSPATPLFDKSRTLYAIDLAKASIRREKLAVIVEGYTDVMAAHQAGFTNVVASLGTALTHGQVELATRYADAVALAYDVDLAGEAATQRGLVEELGPEAVRKVRVIRIPAGKDPDELVRTDPDAWRAAVDGALPVMDYFIEREAGAIDGSSVAARLQAADRILEQLARVPDPLWQGTYVQELARRLDLNEQDLRQRLGRPRPAASAPHRAASMPIEAPAGAELPPLEAEVLLLLLRHPVLAAELPADRPLPLRDEVGRALGAAWLAEVARTPGTAPAVEGFIDGLDPGSADLARSLRASGASMPPHDPDTAREELRICLLRLREQRLDERIRNGRVLLEAAQRDGDEARLKEIQRGLDRLGRQKAEVTSERVMKAPALAGGPRRS